MCVLVMVAFWLGYWAKMKFISIGSPPPTPSSGPSPPLGAPVTVPQRKQEVVVCKCMCTCKREKRPSGGEAKN